MTNQHAFHHPYERHAEPAEDTFADEREQFLSTLVREVNERFGVALDAVDGVVRVTYLNEDGGIDRTEQITSLYAVGVRKAIEEVEATCYCDLLAESDSLVVRHFDSWGSEYDVTLPVNNELGNLDA